MGVWMCRCVQVWACGCVGERMCGCVGVCRCGCVDMCCYGGMWMFVWVCDPENLSVIPNGDGQTKLFSQ